MSTGLDVRWVFLIVEVFVAGFMIWVLVNFVRDSMSKRHRDANVHVRRRNQRGIWE